MCFDRKRWKNSPNVKRKTDKRHKHYTDNNHMKHASYFLSGNSIAVRKNKMEKERAK